MGYPTALLNQGEKILVDSVPHWSYMLGAMAMISLAVVATIIMAIIQPVLVLIGFICILVVAIGSLGRFLRWRTTNFVLTTDRLVERTGIIAKHGIEIPLDRITNISFHQTLKERILGTGDIVVESAGENGHQRFTDVEKPEKLQNLIYRQADLADRDNNAGDGGGGSGALSLPEQLEKLAQLRDRGVLSEEEFAKTKQELLDKS